MQTRSLPLPVLTSSPATNPYCTKVHIDGNLCAITSAARLLYPFSVGWL